MMKFAIQVGDKSKKAIPLDDESTLTGKLSGFTDLDL